MAAVLASSALVPTMVAQAADTSVVSVSEVVFEYQGQLLQLPLVEYLDAESLGDLDGTQSVKYIKDNKGNVYNLVDYLDAYALNNNSAEEAFKELQADKKEVTLEQEIADGKIVDGKVVADETPEEKVNETFFYNLAA